MDTVKLARSITRDGSKQTYVTARLMVDRELVDDFLSAYAYFRWVDDVIDVYSRTSKERITFMERQRTIIDGLFNNKTIDNLCDEEKILAELIRHRTPEDEGLASFIHNMFAIIEFDAHRKGRLIKQHELAWYTERLGISVTDGIQYFIGNGHPYPRNKARILAATAAHITHLLRDMLKDIADGFINIPKEYLDAHNISPEDFAAQAYRSWVQERVELARRFFSEGKRYLDLLEVLRCKIVGYWYCARFEGVLDAIERDQFVLRETYNERRSILTHIKIGWIGIVVTLRHMFRKLTNIFNQQFAK
jgi:phytoene/squalene synthetase